MVVLRGSSPLVTWGNGDSQEEPLMISSMEEDGVLDDEDNVE
jgi:hypothetical protein